MNRKEILDRIAAFAVADNAQGVPDDLIEVLVDYGSATVENLNMSQRLEVGWVPELTGGSSKAVKIKGKNIRVSDLLNTAENRPLPTAVAERYPSLSQEEWNAALRFATLVLTLLEHDSPT